jgi:ElaB/YqjD/DUF883 family membrane-anchored ribosome-binding protein
MELFVAGHVLSEGSVTNSNILGTLMTTRAAKSAAAEEIAAIEKLIGDLEKRLRRLSGSAKREASGATGDVGEFVSEALSNIMDRVRDSASGVGNSVADEATRIGTDAFKKLTDEIESRPLIMLGVAAGIGFLFGLSNRR